MLNSQGRNLGHSVTAARTSGLFSIQGDLGESGKGILEPVLLTQMITQVSELLLLLLTFDFGSKEHKRKGLSVYLGSQFQVI